MRSRGSTTTAAAVLLFAAGVGRAGGPAEPKPAGPPEPASRTARDIEGWTVRVDDRLLEPAHRADGERGLAILRAKLAEIASVVAPDRLARLRAVTIVLDLTHGGLRPAQYHPSPGWLVSHGYARDLAKCVHIPCLADFIDARFGNAQPWAVLHELAHAYHDQVFGFDDARIRAAWEAYEKSGRGEATLHISGNRVRHYALTDPMEFFAEMSEAYFGENDFFPFNRAELKTAEPQIHDLLRSIWGPVAAGSRPPDPMWVPAGARRIDLEAAGKKGFLFLPDRPARGGARPWVWYAPTFIGGHPDPSHEWLFVRLLGAGFAIAGLDVGESYGSPAGRAAYTELHRLLTEAHGLSARACLLAQSRGGLMLYNWAAEHPDLVDRIAGIYPVCDPSSWPGLDGACGAYGLTAAELGARLAEHNPIDRLAPLARAGVPILHVHGDADGTVPLERNSGELARRYRALGGPVDLVVVAGKGHQVCPEFFESKALLEFLLAGGRAGRRGRF